MLAGGLWLLANTALYRQAEAWSAAHVVDSTVGQGTYLQPHSAFFFAGLRTGHAVGLRIDQLCSTGAIWGLMLVVTGLLLIFAGLRVYRALLALGAMIGLLALVNTIRLAALSWTVTKCGLTGWFEWLHLYGGAAV
jgi:exosortase/archaeosortase family protein